MAQYTEMGKKEKTTITILKLPLRSPLVGPGCTITAITRFRSDWGVDEQKGGNGRRCCSLMDWRWVAFTNGQSIIEHPLSARLPRPLANIH